MAEHVSIGGLKREERGVSAAILHAATKPLFLAVSFFASVAFALCTGIGKLA